MIDGGKGQLSVANEVLKNYEGLSCDLISLAKERSSKGELTKEERVFFIGQMKAKTLSKYSLTFRILTQIRDEAHRFAITRHRKKRSKLSLHSSLLEIKGVGPKTHQRLIEAFKGIEGIKKASMTELMEKGKVSEKIAKLLKENLASKKS